MKISVVVCTYNRSQVLLKALESIAVQNIPQSVQWDVLVVDNNSSDQTREVMERYCNQSPDRFNYILESKQGLSHARNAGIEKSRGDVVAFTDDDAIVEPDWLWNLTSSLGRGEWAGAGGRIIPVWSGALPKWLSNDELNSIGTYGGFYLGPEAGPLTRPFYGGNMAIRREALERYGGFRVDLGRSSNNLQGREDVELANRLFAAGEQLRYEPNAVIRHPVAESRMTKSYVLRWHYWDGRSEIADTGQFEKGPSIMGVPFVQIRRLLRWTLQAMVSISPQKRFFCQRNVWILAGYIVSSYHSFRHRDTRTQASTRVPSE